MARWTVFLNSMRCFRQLVGLSRVNCIELVVWLFARLGDNLFQMLAFNTVFFHETRLCGFDWLVYRVVCTQPKCRHFLRSCQYSLFGCGSWKDCRQERIVLLWKLVVRIYCFNLLNFELSVCIPFSFCWYCASLWYQGFWFHACWLLSSAEHRHELHCQLSVKNITSLFLRHFGVLFYLWSNNKRAWNWGVKTHKRHKELINNIEFFLLSDSLL